MKTKKRSPYAPKPYRIGDSHFRQAQRMYLLLMSRAWTATARSIDERVLQAQITYGTLCVLTLYGPNAGRTRGAPLGILGYYCVANGFPCLNALVINKDTGEPGHGVVTRPGVTVEDEQRACVAFDWARYPVPTIAMLRAAFEREAI